MAADVGMAGGGRPALFSEEELGRLAEFDKIVKLSEIITSGKHPRIKVPPHLAPSSRSTGSPVSAPPLPSEHRDSAKGRTRPSTNGRDAISAHARDSLKASGENGQQAAAVPSLPGLGLAPGNAATAAKLPAPQGSPALSEFSSQRAKIEAALREQADDRGAKAKNSEAPFDLAMDEILQRARQLEQTFTPPPAAVPSNDDTNVRGTRGIAAAAAPSARAGNHAASSAVADSGDDETFYSSKFDTPEYGLTSRIPAESDNDDVDMRDSSDYEPELDGVPSPKSPSQQQSRPGPTDHQQPPQQLAASFSQIPNQTHTDILASLVAQNLHAQQSGLYQNSALLPGHNSFAPWAGSPPGPSGGAPPISSGLNNPTEAAFQRQAGPGVPRQPSPFVRTHDLSPVAPQPEHISSLTRLPLAVEQQQRQQQDRAFPGAPAQVALLRTGGPPVSSPDSSSQVGSRATDKKKGKKKAGSKRKADQPAISPRIKVEPRSPSPMRALPPQRPYKRQRQEARAAQEAAHRYSDDEYSPTEPRNRMNSHATYVVAHAVREEGRGPLVYDRVDPADGGGRLVRPRDAAVPASGGVQRFDEQRGYEAYEAVSANYAPRNAPAGWQPAAPPAAVQYVRPGTSQASLRPVRAASHALVETSSGYPIQPPRPIYSGSYSGRTSVRPEVFGRDQPPSPAVALAPPGRIVVDEFNREYFEPAMPEARHKQATMEAGPYEPGVAYEHLAARKPYPPATLYEYARVEPQPLLHGYEGDDTMYERVSPAFAAPRRVFTQPGYVTREYVGYPQQREYSERPAQYAAPPERRVAVDDAPSVRDFVVRASTARPPNTSRYDVPPPPPHAARYVERVGSVLPPDSGMQAGHGFTSVLASGPIPYDGRGQGGVPSAMTGSVYVDHPHGHEVIREYSARPEPQALAQRAYSVRPGPAPPPPLPPPFYAEQPPLGGGPPVPDYVYPDGNVRHDVYR